MSAPLEPLAWLITQAREWILAQRQLHRPVAVALPVDCRRRLAPFFAREIFNIARFRVVPAIDNPPFLAEAKALGIPVTLDFTQMAGITFQDTILVSEAVEILDMSALLFHELVHVVQYEILGGVDEFSRQYVLGYATGGFEYATIPLEAVAYELQQQFEADPAVPFSVRDQIAARFSRGAPP